MIAQLRGERIRGEFLPGDELSLSHISSAVDVQSCEIVLLPVWILAYRYGGKPYRVVVNAVTGQVNGERPWSPIKIGIAVFFGIVVAIILAVLFGGGQDGGG